MKVVGVGNNIKLVDVLNSEDEIFIISEWANNGSLRDKFNVDHPE